MLHLGIDGSNIRQGGGTTHLCQLLGAADPPQSGIDRVTVWASRSTVASLPVRTWLNVRNDPWIGAALPLRLLGQQFVLPRNAVDAGCDVLFSPGGTSPRNCGISTVTMSQNMLPFEPNEAKLFGRFSPARLKMSLLRYSQGISFERANGLIFLTSYAKNVVTNTVHALPAAQALIPHGVERRFFQSPRVQREITQCSNEEPFRLLYVSILMPYKHQVEVALAVSQLRNMGLPIEIQFIGAPWGDYGRQFRTLLNSLDPDHKYLIWTGAEPYDSLHKFYGDADAFVFASSCENLPNIMIEAMAAGLPIICSDRGPMPEVLGNAGVYFDPYLPASIADAIQQTVLDTALRTHIAECARRKAVNYSWEVCARKTFEFIATVATKRSLTP